MNDTTISLAPARPRTHSPLFRPEANCCSVEHASRIAVLVDAADYFEAFAQAAERAQRSIFVLAWDFDSRAQLSFDAGSRHDTTVGDFLNALARRRKRLEIRILDWDFPLIFGIEREWSPLYGLSWTPHRRVHFRYDSTHPLAGSHHQKVVVIDDKIAFVGGLDLTCRRWDTPEHRPDDPRRMTAGKPYPPFHDVMMAVDGAAARALANIARRRWRKATGERVEAVQVDADPWPESLPVDFADANVCIACTTPAAEGEEGIRQVEQLYVDMIAAARRYIYIENQYFTSNKIGGALAARLGEPDGPEIVVVSRLLSHGWLEEMTMHVLRARLVRELRAADRYNRFHIYYPDVDGLADNTCIDVHSKVMVVDDEWLRIGSANVSNRSMGLDTECDLVIEAEGRADLASGIRAMRDRLIGEHVGVNAEEVGRCVQQAGSMSAAIGRLRSEHRRLKPLEDPSEWSDAVVNAIAVADPERPVSMEALVEQFAPSVEVKRRVPIGIKLAAAGGALLGLALAWRYTPLAGLITADVIIAQAEAFSSRWWAPLIILLAYTPASVVMFPRPLITLAAVVAFGPWLGFTYAMGGILVAAVASYVVGRLLSRDTVRRIAGKKLNRLSEALRQRGLVAMAAVRLVPLAPFAVEGVVAGAIRIKLWHFVVGTFIGMLPGVLAATVFGDQLETGLRDPSQINYWLVGGAIGLLAVASVVVHRWIASIDKDRSNARGKAKGKIAA